MDLFSFNKIVEFRDVDKHLGMMYVGSKSRYAKALLEFMYIQTGFNKFYDVFGGGGAMSEYATICGFDTHYNDFNFETFQVFDYFARKGGVLTKELLEYCDRDWHKEILANKNKDLQSSLFTTTYSYAGAGEYFYTNKKTEKYNKLAHNVIFFLDKTSAKELDSLYKVTYFQDFLNSHYIHLSQDKRKTLISKMLLYLAIFEKYNFKNMATTLHELLKIKRKDLLNYVNKTQNTNYKDLKNIDVDYVYKFRHITYLKRAELLNYLKNYNNLSTTNLSYEQIDYTKDSIIYCDIPYFNSFKYRAGDFDFEKFYTWACNMARIGYKIFISELWMPSDRFRCVLGINGKNRVCSKAREKEYVEKLFIPIV